VGVRLAPDGIGLVLLLLALVNERGEPTIELLQAIRQHLHVWITGEGGARQVHRGGTGNDVHGRYLHGGSRHGSVRGLPVLGVERWFGGHRPTSSLFRLGPAEPRRW